jgi:hypothetical protein
MLGGHNQEIQLTCKKNYQKDKNRKSRSQKKKKKKENDNRKVI